MGFDEVSTLLESIERRASSALSVIDVSVVDILSFCILETVFNGCTAVFPSSDSVVKFIGLLVLRDSFPHYLSK